jgi:hypothetical protein
MRCSKHLDARSPAELTISSPLGVEVARSRRSPRGGDDATLERSLETSDDPDAKEEMGEWLCSPPTET